MENDAAFEEQAQAQAAQIAARDREHKKAKKKEEVSKRPGSAPPARDSGAESAASMAWKKSADTRREWQAIGTEYHAWVRNVSAPKFQLPFAKTDNEVRTKELLRRRKQKERKEVNAYY